MRRISEAHRMSADTEERLQRALQENNQLKKEVQEAREKLKMMQVKFQRLTADLKRVSPNMLKQVDDALPALLPAVARPASASGRPLHSQDKLGDVAWAKQLSSASAPQMSGFKSGSMEDSAQSNELRSCREALQRAELEISTLHAKISASSTAAVTSSASPALAVVMDQLQQDVKRTASERDRLSAENATLREKLARTQAERESVHLPQQQHLIFERQSYDVLNERVKGAETARWQSEAEYQNVVDTLTRERDALALKLQLLEQERREDAAGRRQHEFTSVDSMRLAQLQEELHDKSKQITVLTSRMQGAQQQAETLKGECSHLVEEIKRFHTMHAATKRQLFDVEHEKSLLQVQCARLDELEMTLQRKSEEVVRIEQELLRTVGTLQTCNRETEEAVRRELASRISDLQEMRDSAESRRREKEMQLLEAQQQIAALQGQLKVSQEDVQMYREKLRKAETEGAELARNAALAGHAVTEFGDDTVRRALAVAAMRKSKGVKYTSVATATSKGVVVTPRGQTDTPEAETEDTLDMWEALQWDEGWEAQQLREALASAALDMELADTRCSQMSEQLNQGRLMLQQISQERDVLLEENIEMRRRLTHVQTIFAKQQLESYRLAKAGAVAGGDAAKHDGAITFVIRDVECNSGLLRTLGVGDAAGAAVALFFSLDGLQSYDTMLSPTFYSLDEPLDIRFRYDHLEKDEVTINDIRNTTFVFQMHRVHGTTNVLLAMAEIPGVALLSSRELMVSECIPLLNGSGDSVGVITVEMCASNLMLPVLLDQPLTSTFLTAEAMRAALVALRGVMSLRVQVFRADGLLDSPTPQPYVFYTASTASGLNCVRDTIVRTSTKSFTTNPVFDADPVDHRVVVDRELIQFMAGGAIVFVVFDERASEVQANLGVAEVPLRPLLNSPLAVVRTTERLHPQGTLSLGLSWVCRT